MSKQPPCAAVRAVCRTLCALPFVVMGTLAVAAPQTVQGTSIAPEASTSLAGAGGAPVPPPPSFTSSALAGASKLSWSGYFEALAILCFALALLWALLWLVKRHSRGGFLGSTASMRVESRLALGPKKWIIVVRYMDRHLVLGLTDNTISLLTEIPLEQQPREKTAVKPPPAGASTPAGGSPAASGGQDDADNLFSLMLKAGKDKESPAP